MVHKKIEPVHISEAIDFTAFSGLKYERVVKQIRMICSFRNETGAFATVEREEELVDLYDLRIINY